MARTLAVETENLEALRQRFAEQLEAKIEQLDERWHGSDGALADGECLAALELMTHNLVGAGTTFGYPAVSEAARALERIFERALNPASTQVLNPADRIDELIARLRDAAREPTEPVGRIELVPPRPEPESGDGARVVYVVDDDEAVAAHLAGEIAHFGYRTRTFRSPRRMFLALPGARPDLVIMDMVFPEGPTHGLERAGALVEPEGWNVPVVFTSERGDFEARLAAVRAGGSDYFVKPVDSIKLVERIDRLTTRREPEPYRVLVIDDDPILGRTYAAALSEAGMQVETVADPREVMARLDEFEAELILTEVHLPHCTGLDLAKVIRQQQSYASVPIVFLSTESRLDRQLLAMSLGGDDFLTKPIRPGHLVAAVSTRVQRARVIGSLMVRDSMTGALNHANTLEHLALEVSRADRAGNRFCFVLIDLDHFKKVNDTYGHPTGDRVIKSLARMLRQRLRKTDVVGRYGGEEFAVILPDSPVEQAEALLEDLRSQFGALPQTDGKNEFRVTFSAGLAEYPAFETAGALTEAADRALYGAKSGGRNRIEVAG